MNGGMADKKQYAYMEKEGVVLYGKNDRRTV